MFPGQVHLPVVSHLQSAQVHLPVVLQSQPGQLQSLPIALLAGQVHLPVVSHLQSAQVHLPVVSQSQPGQLQFIPGHLQSAVGTPPGHAQLARAAPHWGRPKYTTLEEFEPVTRTASSAPGAAFTGAV